MASQDPTVTRKDLDQLFVRICSYVAGLETVLEWIVAKDETACRIVVEPRVPDPITIYRPKSEELSRINSRELEEGIEPVAYIVSDLKIEVDENLRSHDDEVRTEPDFTDDEVRMEPDFTDETSPFKIDIWDAERDDDAVASSFSCPERPDRFSKKTRRKRRKKLEPVPTHFQCEFCDQGFDDAESISGHLREDHPDRVGDVGYCCNRRYVYEKTMVKHIRLKHEDRPLFPCEHCEKTFVEKFSLTFHLETIHPERLDYDREFVCHVFTCQMSFSSKTILDRHERRIHILEKEKSEALLYSPDSSSLPEAPEAPEEPTSPCPTCGEEVSNLTLHSFKHHKTSSSCHVCGKSYSNRRQMLAHVRFMHFGRNFKCPHCEKTFREGGNLNTHIQVVHVKNRFPCGQCSKSYAVRSDLLLHVKAIHENKKWPCRVCSKGLLRPSDRNRHEREVHGERIYDLVGTGRTVFPV